jgi:hypothetical protein
MAGIVGILGIISLILPWTFTYNLEIEYFGVGWLLFAYVFFKAKVFFSTLINWPIWMAAINGIAFILVLIGSILLIIGELPKVGSSLILLGFIATIFEIIYSASISKFFLDQYLSDYF